MNRNPTPSRTSAAAIFAGVLGSRRRRPSAVQSAAKSGLAMISTPGFTDWNQEAGTRKPWTIRSVRCSAKKFIEEAACS